MGPQQFIAHYRIIDKLGEGGMGAVYRATDTKLNRDVAIKVLPATLAGDAQYMARFEREAQTLASLNHPNIATIFGIEQGAIVMELVEGEPPRGPLPVETVVAYARQIAAGLEAAHEKGIIHRDLKPANIKVTRDGTVKLLDFGLAKATETTTSSSSVSPTLSPTLSLAMTQAGMILGTAGYMSPEQARGQVLDKRADIWAFGVVVYELLTGSVLFHAGTVSDTLAAVLRGEIDLSALPADTPPAFRRLLRRCLERDRKRRLPDIAMVRLDLDEPPEKDVPAALPPAARAQSSRLAWGVAALLLFVLAGVVIVDRLRPNAADPVTVSFIVPQPEGTTEPNAKDGWAVASPDGRNLAIIAIGPEGTTALWVRPFGEPSAHRLDKTEDARMPFWSPDSQAIAFFADDKLKRVPVAGGTPQTICDAIPSAQERDRIGGGTWNSAGVIVFSTGASSSLMRVLAAGGPATPVTKLDTSAGETRHSWPQFLPDGRHILYYAGNTDLSKSAIYVQELGSAERVLVMRSILRAEWAAPGYLLFPKLDTLYAQRMDPKSFHLSGEPVSVAERIGGHDPSGLAPFEISGGVLVYRSSAAPGAGQLAWYGRDGTRQAAVGKPALYTAVRLSPDDRSAMVSIGRIGHADIWTVDLTTGSLRRVTNSSNATFVLGPWSPDARRMAVNLISSQGILEATPASGTTRPLGPAPFFADDWSPDGEFLFCRDINGEQWSLLRTDGSQKVEPVGKMTRGMYVRFAPDGKSVAYVSSASGRGEIVLASYPSFAEKRQVSIDGGVHPSWRKDGKELLFQAPDGTVMSVEIRAAGARIEAGIPKRLFMMQHRHSANSGSFVYWPASNGQRFLVIERQPASAPQTVVVLNWAAGLKQ